MLFSAIPAELRDRVCAFLPKNDLLALAATSSLFLPVAQRRLYRHLAVSPAAHNLQLITVLARNPRLARLVRTLAVNVPHGAALLNAFYRDLAAALSLMTELIDLEICIDPAASWVLSHTPNTIFARLTRFSSTFPFDSHVTNFLERIPALTELELDPDPVSSHTESIAPLSPSILSALNEFTGPSHVARAVVPGRPVQSIHITSGDLTTETVQTLKAATADVVMLCASTSAQPVPFLQSLTLHLPRIEYLRLMTTYTFTEAPDAAFYESVANALNTLPALVTFELSGMHWGSYTTPQEGDKRVWQSQPLTADSPSEADLVIDDDLYFDEFFAY
ncbi:hypothetical protein EYR40_005500 [Pleurotus pulmonarius]|nr:hypothetical protein EYR40_005500 [Pleurotus pulmonarius]